MQGFHHLQTCQDQGALDCTSNCCLEARLRIMKRLLGLIQHDFMGSSRHQRRDI